MQYEPIISIKHLKTYLGNKWVHNDLNLTINQGEIITLVGGSGSGKTTLMRIMLGLHQSYSGEIIIFNTAIQQAKSNTVLLVKQRCGVLFQNNGLFSALTILENVIFPLKEYTLLDLHTITELASLKLQLVGLNIQDWNKYPAELSGGMLKRASLARALAMDPEIIFLDEPTSGLDPHSTAAINELIGILHHSLKITIVIVTHDLTSIQTLADRIAFLGDGKIVGYGKLHQILTNPHPLIKQFFSELLSKRHLQENKHGN